MVGAAQADLEAPAPGREKAAGPAAGAAPPCGAVPAPAQKRRFAKVLESIKSSGVEAHPEAATAEAHLAGQACLLLYGLNMLFVGRIHLALLVSDARFVSAADEPRPHEPRTLRGVRVLDVLVSVSWACVLLWLARELSCRRLQPVHARRMVVASMGIAAVLYLLGALCDYGQCHLQAGGIGSRCNGVSCMHVAFLCMLCTVFGHWYPRYLGFVVFVAQGWLRLDMVFRDSVAGSVGIADRLLCCSIALCFVALPLYVYAQELATAAQKLCVQRWRQESDERMNEFDNPVQKPAVDGHPLRQVAALAVDSVPARLTQDESRLGAVGKTSPRVEALCEEAPERVKVDDSKVGTVSTTNGDGEKVVMKTEPGTSVALDGALLQWATMVATGDATIDAKIAAVAKQVATEVSTSAAYEEEKPLESSKSIHADRKRRRRAEQNQLVAALDRLLPDGARRGGFKGAGPRSAGVWGRSFFNVLTDAIQHLRAFRAAQAEEATSRNGTLAALGFCYRDGLNPAPRMPVPSPLASSVCSVCSLLFQFLWYATG
jgi:hypothetical protein